MKKERDREIVLWKTIFASFWIYLIIALLFIPAIFYARDMLISSQESFKAVGFWALMMLFLVMKFVHLLPDCTFYIYKKKAKCTKGDGVKG